jgi:hypothetical protein
VFGSGNVGAAAYPERFYAALCTGHRIDIAKEHSEFMDDLKTRCDGKLLRTDAQRLDHNNIRQLKIVLKLGLRIHQPDSARVKRTCRFPHLVTPALEVRQVWRHKVCKRIPPFLCGVRIENHADQARPDIIFDDQ